MFKKILFMFTIAMVIPVMSFGATYYVDHTLGLDTNPGTEALPFQHSPGMTACSGTSGCGAVTLTADDTVKFKKGETWDASIVVPTSGTSGHPITFTSYGTSTAKPKFDGAVTVSGWTGGEITHKWHSTAKYKRYAVWVDGTLGTRVANDAALDAVNKWYWDSDVLYLYSFTNPDDGKLVESYYRHNVWCDTKGHIVFDGLEFYRGGDSIDISPQAMALRKSHNIVVKNCDFIDSIWYSLRIYYSTETDTGYLASEALVLTRDIVPEQEGLFALRVRGTSMIDAMVDDGDIVVMKKQSEAKNGDMVAARMIDRDEMTLKYFYREPNRVRLQPGQSHSRPDLHPPEQRRDSRPRRRGDSARALSHTTAL